MLNKLGASFLVIALILVLGFGIHLPYLSVFPTQVHNWALTDRLAMVDGFVENGFDLFSPQTWVLNHQFPNYWLSEDVSPVTSVDFPINEWLVSIFTKLTGFNAIVTLRTYYLLISFLGLFFVFKIGRLLGNHLYIAAFMVIFTLTSPLYTYYQSGMLPTMSCLSFSLVGIHHYLKFLQKRQNKIFFWALFFLVLSALSRLSFAVPLIAVITHALFLKLKKHQLDFRSFAMAMLSLMPVFLYWLYNQYLRQLHGSIFLGNPLPPNDFSHFIEIFQVSIHEWGNTYFATWHYLFVLALLVLIPVRLLIRKKEMIFKLDSWDSFLLIYLFGATVFGILMMRQFQAHDYYFLDILFLPIMLMVIKLCQWIDFPSRVSKSLLGLCLFLLALPMIDQAQSFEESRMTVSCGNEIHNTYLNFRGSDEFLEDMEVSKTARLLVLYSGAPNLPFLLMKRHGYAMMHNKKPDIQKMMTWNYDYAVLESDFFLRETYLIYPHLLNHLEYIGSNGELILCRKRESPKSALLSDFMPFKKGNLKSLSTSDFETEATALWRNFEWIEDTMPGNHLAKINANMLYGLGLNAQESNLFIPKSHLLIEGDFLKNSPQSVYLMLEMKMNGKQTYCKRYDLNKLLHKTNEFEHLTLIFNLPHVPDENTDIDCFIFNPYKNEIWVDNLSLKAY